MVCYIPRRYIFGVMAHLGLFVVYSLRVNLSVALVAMVNSNHSHHGHPPECNRAKNTTMIDNVDGKFNWNQNQQGLILSSFFYGYLVTQFPGGMIANRLGGKHVFGTGVLVTALLTLLTPLAARHGLYTFLLVRVLMGIGEGVTFPAMHALIAKWAPPADRTKFVSYAFSGMYTGTIFAMPVSGLLASSHWKWPAVFYVFGILGMVWYLLWCALVFNKPEDHPYISEEEKSFIANSQHGCSAETRRVKTPWKSILTSPPVWAVSVAHFANNWVWYMILTELPSYFKDVLDFDIKQNGFLSALPFIAAFLSFLFTGWLADLLRRTCVSTTNTRRLMALISFYPASVFLILASYSGCTYVTWSVSCMVLATGLLVMNGSSYLVNHLDIAPRFAGVLMGVSNTPGTIAGCLTPSVTGYFINDDPSAANYRKVFFVAAGVCVAGATFFLAFLSGEEQPWNKLKSNDEHKRLISEDEPIEKDTDI